LSCDQFKINFLENGTSDYSSSACRGSQAAIWRLWNLLEGVEGRLVFHVERRRERASAQALKH
jgi:hypothetical protein